MSSKLTGVPIHGGSYNEGGESRAFDGDDATAWASLQLGTAVANTAHIGLDVQTLARVESVRVLSGTSDKTPSSVMLRASQNGTSWNNIGSFNLNISNWAEYMVTNKDAYRYWDLLATANTMSGTAWFVYELEFYGSSDQKYAISPLYQSAMAAALTAPLSRGFR